MQTETKIPRAKVNGWTEKEKGLIETEQKREILVRWVFIQLWVIGWPYTADVNGFRVCVYDFETTLTPKFTLKTCLAYKLMSTFKHPSALVFGTDLSCDEWES